MFHPVSARSRATALSARTVAATAVSLALLSGCAPASGTASDTASEPAPSPSVSVAAASAVTVVDGWVKAADDGMTAAFGILENSAGDDATLVSATTAAAAMVELHEVVMVDGSMVMQPKEGGIVIPAGGSHELAPGGDHIMLMGVGTALQPGDEITVTLTFSDGSTLDQVFTVKEFTGADEQYVGGMNGHGNG